MPAAIEAAFLGRLGFPFTWLQKKKKKFERTTPRTGTEREATASSKACCTRGFAPRSVGEAATLNSEDRQGWHRKRQVPYICHMPLQSDKKYLHSKDSPQGKQPLSN